MDGIIEPILRRLKALELHVWGPPTDDSGHDAPAQTVAPSRMPAAPGLPMAPYDPNVEPDDETDAAIAAEQEARTTRRPSFIPTEEVQPDPNLNPDGSEDPTLNMDGSTRRRRKLDPVIEDAL